VLVGGFGHLPRGPQCLPRGPEPPDPHGTGCDSWFESAPYCAQDGAFWRSGRYIEDQLLPAARR